MVVLGASKNMKQWKFRLFEAADLDAAGKKRLEEIAKKAGWFKNEKRTEREVKEYPDE